MGKTSPQGHFSKSIVERLIDRLDMSGDCWLWTGHLSGRDGRGYLRVHGKNEIASRVAYKLFVGSIPAGMSVLHKCDNPACCNPKHLFLGNQSENMLDAYSKNRKTVRGQSNPKSIITPNIVREIRARYLLDGGASLAREFGLDRTQPYRIFNKLTWGHVE